MLEPYEVLGIKKEITVEEAIKEIEERIASLSRVLKKTESTIKEFSDQKIKYRGAGKKLFESEIEDDFADKFACQLFPNSRYLSPIELKRLIDKIKTESDMQRTGDSEYVYYSNVLMSQATRTKLRQNEYRRIIDDYMENQKSPQARDALTDLYMKMKFEDAVTSIASQAASMTPRSFDVEKDRQKYLETLLKMPDYIKFKQAYEKLATREARNDLVPELYVTSRIADLDLYQVASSEWKKHIIDREERFFESHIKNVAQSSNLTQRERLEREMSENQNHDYSWGIAIADQTPIIDGDEVDTSDFQGRIYVKHLGFFSAESLFRKRKILSDKHEKVEIKKYKATIGGKKTKFALVRHTPDEEIPESMREYYYRYLATKQLYDNMYLVKKVDSQGIIREDVIISPVTIEQMRSDIPRDFLNNVYFSNYALDIAKLNGGFAGDIVETPEGLSISTKYNEDEIASSLIYQNGSIGRIMNRSKKGDGIWRDVRSAEANVLLKYSGVSKERTDNE